MKNPLAADRTEDLRHPDRQAVQANTDEWRTRGEQQALAEAAAQAGAKTTLLLGPTHLTPGEDSTIQLERFRSTSELAELLQAHWPAHDILFMNAAVADYRPRKSTQQEKLRREGQNRSLDLEPTPDLLAALASTSRPEQLRVGWALEPRAELLASAQAKLTRKKLAVIVANPLETIDAEAIEAHVLLANGQCLEPPHPKMDKVEFARWLMKTILALRAHRSTTS